MYRSDHNPPHFHARYGDAEAYIAIDDLRIIKGSLSPKALSLVRSWAKKHKKELRQERELAVQDKELFWIMPLE